MIVVGIIAVIVSIARPRLTLFLAKAKQSEARVNLRAISVLMETYRVENGNYASATFARIGYTEPTNARYFYLIPGTGPTRWQANALISLATPLCAGMTPDQVNFAGHTVGLDNFVNETGVVNIANISCD